MTFDNLIAIKPGIWIQQTSTKQFFIRMLDESTPEHQLSVDEMNVCSGGFFNITTGQIVHASYLIDDTEPQLSAYADFVSLYKRELNNKEQ